MTRTIPLENSDQVALVDDEDYELVASWPWTLRNADRPNGGYVHNSDVGYMHRLICDAPPNLSVDHINGAGLDNRRANLREATHQENLRNRRLGKNSTSGFKGVSAAEGKGRWRAQIMLDDGYLGLGTHASAVAAARAYDLAASEHFGVFARLNFSPTRDWLFPHEAGASWPPLEDRTALSRRWDDPK